MLVSALILTGLLALVVLLMLLLLVAAMSRHRKAAMGELELIGATAAVETMLGPQGSVLVRGELWPARSSTGDTIERGRRVRIVGARGLLLQVEPAE